MSKFATLFLIKFIFYVRSISIAISSFQYFISQPSYALKEVLLTFSLLSNIGLTLGLSPHLNQFS